MCTLYKRIIIFHFEVICNADLIFINVIARWPGSVQDARILRQSPLFTNFEGNRPRLDGLILGDSGYMLRSWLMTPLLNPATRQPRNYNFAHSSTRTTVERSIGVAKQRFHCLRCGLRLQPPKACKVIIVCMMLHNHARRLNLPAPADDSSDSSSSSDDESDGGGSGGRGGGNAVGGQAMTDRARTAAGKAV